MTPKFLVLPCQAGSGLVLGWKRLGDYLIAQQRMVEADLAGVMENRRGLSALWAQFRVPDRVM